MNYASQKNVERNLNTLRNRFSNLEKRISNLNKQKLITGRPTFYQCDNIQIRNQSRHRGIRSSYTSLLF